MGNIYILVQRGQGIFVRQNSPTGDLAPLTVLEGRKIKSVYRMLNGNVWLELEDESGKPKVIPKKKKTIHKER